MPRVWSVVRKRSIPVVRLPELSVLVLGRHLDDPWFVNDACGAAALFNDADDPGLVALLLLNVLAVCGCLLSGQADQQAPCKTSDINAVIFMVSYSAVLWCLERASNRRIYRAPKSGLSISARRHHKGVALSPAAIPTVSQQGWCMWQTPVLPQVASRGSLGSKQLRHHDDSDAHILPCLFQEPLGSTARTTTSHSVALQFL